MMITTRREYSPQKPYRITPRQIEVLSLVARREYWTIGEVAAALGVSSAAATKAVARLEKKGLVTRSADTMDRRCVNVRVTCTGSELIGQTTKAV